MFPTIESILQDLRPCFSRQAAFEWFVIIIMGVIAPCPHPYAASLPFRKPLVVSRWTIGSGLDAKYL